MSLITVPCERCGLKLHVAFTADGRQVELEAVEGAVRLDGSRVIPMVNVYVPHQGRCIGEETVG